jgi:uncharacterized protein
MKIHHLLAATVTAVLASSMPMSEGYGQENSLLNCRTATKAADVTVCGDPQLARLDSELGQIFGEHFAAATGANMAQLQEDLRVWLAKRDQCGYRQVCLRDTYQSFIDYLNNDKR